MQDVGAGDGCSEALDPLQSLEDQIADLSVKAGGCGQLDSTLLQYFERFYSARNGYNSLLNVQIAQ